MRRLFRPAALVLAAIFAMGTFGLSTLSVAGSDKAGDTYAKREDSSVQLVAADDDDDGDDDSRSRKGTATSRESRDGTRSNRTGVSRDRDHSRGDKTRDRTHDGRGVHRDWSDNRTNDRSRNDTR